MSLFVESGWGFLSYAKDPGMEECVKNSTLSRQCRCGWEVSADQSVSSGLESAGRREAYRRSGPLLDRPSDRSVPHKPFAAIASCARYRQGRCKWPQSRARARTAPGRVAAIGAADD